MEERESKRRSREGVRWIIRERIMEELQERHHMDDGELLEMIDRSIGEMGQEIFLPLKERIWLRGSLFDSFRRLDILQNGDELRAVAAVSLHDPGGPLLLGSHMLSSSICQSSPWTVSKNR